MNDVIKIITKRKNINIIMKVGGTIFLNIILIWR